MSRFSLLAALCLSTAVSAAPIEFKADTLDGVGFDLAAQRGKWVVVNFWATWCGPCIKEMPDLDALDQAHDDIVVVGLAYEETTTAELKSFLSKRPVQYPISIVDVYAPPTAFSTPKGLPTTHLIGPDGELRHSFLGPVTRADIEKFVGSN